MSLATDLQDPDLASVGHTDPDNYHARHNYMKISMTNMLFKFVCQIVLKARVLNSTGSVESQGVRNVVQSSFAEIQPASSLERNRSRKTWRYCGFDCDSTTEQVQLQVGIP